MKKKMLALFLVMIFVLSSVSATAFASSDTNGGEGNGAYSYLLESVGDNFILWYDGFDYTALGNTISGGEEPLILSDNPEDFVNFAMFDFGYSEIVFTSESSFILWDVDFDYTTLGNTIPGEEPLILTPYLIMPLSTVSGTIQNVTINFSGGVVATNVNVNVTMFTSTGGIVSVTNTSGAFNNARWSYPNERDLHGPATNAHITSASGRIPGTVSFGASADFVLGSNHANAGAAVNRTGSGSWSVAQ